VARQLAICVNETVPPFFDVQLMTITTPTWTSRRNTEANQIYITNNVNKTSGMKLPAVADRPAL